MWLLWFWYILELFSSECRKTKNKPITNQLATHDQTVSETKQNKNQTQSKCLITFDTQLKTALTGIANGSRQGWLTLTLDKHFWSYFTTEINFDNWKSTPH